MNRSQGGSGSMSDSNECRGSTTQGHGASEMQKRPPGDDWEAGRSHHSKSNRNAYAAVAPQRIIGSGGDQGGALQQTSISPEDAAAAYASQHNLLNALRVRMDSIGSSHNSQVGDGFREPRARTSISSGSDSDMSSESFPSTTSRESTPRPQERGSSEVSVNCLLNDTNKRKGKKRATEAPPERASFDFSTIDLPPWPTGQQNTQDYVRSIQESSALLGSQIPPNTLSVPPLCPRPDNFVGLGQVMSHFSDGMEKLLTSVHRFQTSTRDILQKQIDAAVKEIKGSVGSTSNTADQSDSEASPSQQFVPRRRRRAAKTRKHFVPSNPGLKNHKEDVRDTQEHMSFMKAIRSHTLILLGIRSYKYLYRRKCELTEEEYLAFESDNPDAIKITPTTFLVDCSRGCESEFNQNAAIVFAEDFLDKIKNHSWYSEETVPIRYRTTDIVIDAFKSHLVYVRSRYKQVVVAPREDSIKATQDKNARLQKASRASRKTRLLKTRLGAMVDHPELHNHVPLVQHLGTQGVSSDESEHEFKRTNIYPRIYHRWRSNRLAALMWKADVIAEQNYSIPMGTRKKGGALLRSRPHTSKFNDCAVAPIGLPRNCYDEDWIATLPARIIQRLQIVDQDYNFEMVDVPSGTSHEAEINEAEMRDPPPPVGTPGP